MGKHPSLLPLKGRWSESIQARLPLVLLGPLIMVRKNGSCWWGTLWQFLTAHEAWGLLLNKGDWERRNNFTEVLMLLTSVTICSLLFFKMITQPKHNRLGIRVRTDAFQGPASGRHLSQGQSPQPHVPHCQRVLSLQGSKPVGAKIIL